MALATPRKQTAMQHIEYLTLSATTNPAWLHAVAVTSLYNLQREHSVNYDYGNTAIENVNYDYGKAARDHLCV